MKIEISNEEKNLKICFRKLRSFVLRISKILGLPSDSEISISFVREETIKSLNAEHRKKNVITDVLSFPSGNFVAGEVITRNKAVEQNLINPESDNIFLGDIIICTLRASEQAVEFGHALEDEIYRLVVHSILHLIGYDHECDKDYKLMHKKEMEILRELGYNFNK